MANKYRYYVYTKPDLFKSFIQQFLLSKNMTIETEKIDAFENKKSNRVNRTVFEIEFEDISTLYQQAVRDNFLNRGQTKFYWRRDNENFITQYTPKILRLWVAETERKLKQILKRRGE